MRAAPSLQPRSVRSADGTHIAYYATEEPFSGAPALVLASGLGSHHQAWQPQIHYFRDRFRFVTWDYRGLFGSARPRTERYGISQHVQDLTAVLEAEGLSRCSLVGWSMGVQVVLEAVPALGPRTTDCLVLINGTAGRPLLTISGVPGVATALDKLIGLPRYGHRLLTGIAGTSRRRRRLAGLLRRLGLIGPTIDAALFGHLIESLVPLDMAAYAQSLRAMSDHDGWSLLPAIEPPALIISGERDPFVPPATAQRMARELPHAEVMIVRGGGHYVCVELPDLINLRLEQFFQQAGLC